MTIFTRCFNTVLTVRNKFITTAFLVVLPLTAKADNIPAMKNATDWMVKTLVGVAITVLSLQIMYRLWQVNQGQKEWSEVAKPILITAAIAATPAIGSALTSLLR